VTTPYVPSVPASMARGLYRSVAQVLRLSSVLQAGGGMSVTWQPVTDILDPYLVTPGLIACRLDLAFTRPGKDALMPLVAGRAPDRTGVLFYDMPTDVNGLPLIKSGDRFAMVSGPVPGTFELRQVPEAAQDYLGAAHAENQVTEVSQALQPGGYTPFPGNGP
jgi:hypothetical protein